jgi:probable HAF family extracellular repeat protein
MCISSVSLAVSYYDITLPSYPPGEVIWHPASLNDNAQIVGPTSMPVNAYLWQNGAITDIPITQGSFETTATDINNAGHVIGGTGDGPGELYNGSQVISLGTLGGSSSMPFALNESDQVVGSSQTSVTNQIHPFLWQNGTLISLGTLGGNYGRAHDINNQGVVESKSGSAQLLSFVGNTDGKITITDSTNVYLLQNGDPTGSNEFLECTASIPVNVKMVLLHASNSNSTGTVTFRVWLADTGFRHEIMAQTYAGTAGAHNWLTCPHNWSRDMYWYAPSYCNNDFTIRLQGWDIER